MPKSPLGRSDSAGGPKSPRALPTLPSRININVQNARQISKSPVSATPSSADCASKAGSGVIEIPYVAPDQEDAKSLRNMNRREGVPAPAQAFEEALHHLELESTFKQNVERKKTPVRYEVLCQIKKESFPLHPIVHENARLQQWQGPDLRITAAQGHPVKRRAEKEHERNRRADPSSYQERESDQEKLRRHKFLNHEPPHGVTNRPKSPNMYSLVNRGMNADVSEDWIVMPVKETKISSQDLTLESAERLSMLQAAKQSLCEAGDAQELKGATLTQKRAGFSLRIYSPMSPNRGITAIDENNPTLEDTVTNTHARPQDPRHHSVSEVSAAQSPQGSGGHIHAKEAAYLRNTAFLESQYKQKQAYLRQLTSARKAKEVAVLSTSDHYTGFRITPSAFSPPWHPSVETGIVVNNPRSVDKYVRNAHDIAKIHMCHISAVAVSTSEPSPRGNLSANVSHDSSTPVDSFFLRRLDKS